MSKRSYVIVLLGLFVVMLTRSSGSAQEPMTAQETQALQHALRNVNDRDLARIIRGFQIAPVRQNLRGKDLALVGLGSYIVNGEGGCNDCHTAPPYAAGGDPFLGEPKRVNAARYLAGGVPFGPPDDPNTPVSRNLTPRASTGLPAGLTWAEFRRTIRTGADLKHRAPFVPSADNDLLQVMPWPVYQDMIDRDLRAVYEYLRTIPTLPSTP